jgi:hypothetical protein
MMTCRKARRSAPILRVVWGLIVSFSPLLLRGGQLGREALSSFPADTQQLVDSNLVRLRASPDYPQIRERILKRQLRYFQDFLRMSGIDPDKDVDEVVLGWRGKPQDALGFYGMAQGRFQPERIYGYYAQSRLPLRQYAGSDLFAFGSGEDPADLFFTFFDSSLAAFGRLPDLKAILDVRQGSANALETNAAFANWEAELEDTAPQWGILTGPSIANLAARWVSGGKGSSVIPSSLLGFVQGVLYRVEWDGGFNSHLVVVCQNAQNASALAALLKLLPGTGQAPTDSAGAAASSALQYLEAHVNGSRVEINATGPAEALDQVLQPN